MRPHPAMDRFGRHTRRKSFSLNNNNNSNRNNNNRRRGRGNRQQGGGNQNRIDSRARGNAPQMLDKYRKLAQDAQHNGDRVQAEYYLQFADHYFRVIADSRARPDEGRSQNRNERDFSNEEEGDEEDFDSSRNARDDRPQDRQRDDRPQDRQRDDRQRDDRPRDSRGNNGNRSPDRQRQQARRDEGQPGFEGEAASEAGDNPFVRPTPARGTRRTRGARDNDGETEEMTTDAGEIDAAALPPSFSAGISAVAQDEDEAGPATRKLPPRRRRKPIDEAGDGDNVTAVG